jgi:hypothetical protein
VGKVKSFALWLAIFAASLVYAIVFMVFVRLYLVDWVEANCLTDDAVGLICVVADIFAYNWRVMLIPAVILTILALTLTKKK